MVFGLTFVLIYAMFQSVWNINTAVADTTRNMLCYLPMEPGPCRGKIPSWFFDSKTSRCTQFDYGGCLGNDNLFRTQDECAQTCLSYEEQRVVPRRRPVPPLPRLDSYGNVTVPDSCLLSKDAGPCAALQSRFYYNTQNGLCEKFLWGGCKGNANQFLTMEDCVNYCVPGGAEDASRKQRPAYGYISLRVISEFRIPAHMYLISVTPPYAVAQTKCNRFDDYSWFRSSSRLRANDAKFPLNVVYEPFMYRACLVKQPDIEKLNLYKPNSFFNCTRNEIYKACGHCEMTCDHYDQQNILCPPNCVTGCFCKSGLYRNRTGQCVPANECTRKQICTDANAEYSECGSTCHESCLDVQRDISCVAVCEAGCFCKKGYLKDAQGLCIPASTCTVQKPRNCTTAAPKLTLLQNDVIVNVSVTPASTTSSVSSTDFVSGFSSGSAMQQTSSVAPSESTTLGATGLLSSQQPLTTTIPFGTNTISASQDFSSTTIISSVLGESTTLPLDATATIKAETETTALATDIEITSSSQPTFGETTVSALIDNTTSLSTTASTASVTVTGIALEPNTTADVLITSTATSAEQTAVNVTGSFAESTTAAVRNSTGIRFTVSRTNVSLPSQPLEASTAVQATTVPVTQQATCDQLGLCPDGMPPTKCLVDPCNNARCPNFPTATCQADFCVGCNPMFFDSNNTEILPADCFTAEFVESLCNQVNCGFCRTCIVYAGQPVCVPHAANQLCGDPCSPNPCSTGRCQKQGGLCQSDSCKRYTCS